MEKSRNYQFWQIQVALLINAIEGLRDKELGRFLLWKYLEINRKFLEFKPIEFRRYLLKNNDTLNYFFSHLHRLAVSENLIWPVRTSFFVLKQQRLRNFSYHFGLLLISPIIVVVGLLKLPKFLAFWFSENLSRGSDAPKFDLSPITELLKRRKEKPEKVEVQVLSGYTIVDKYPLYHFCASLNLKISEIRLVTDSNFLAEIFKDSLNVELIPVRGSVVVDKEKEIAVFSEAFNAFNELITLAENIHYKGIPIFRTFISDWLSKAQLVAVSNEVIKYCLSDKSRLTNILYVTEGNDGFIATMLEALCEEYSLNKPKRFRLYRRDFTEYRVDVIEDDINFSTSLTFLPYSPQAVDQFQEQNRMLDKWVRLARLFPRGISNLCSVPMQLKYPINFIYRSMQEYKGSNPVVAIVQVDRRSIYWKATKSVLTALKHSNKDVFAITERASTFLALREMGIECIFYPDYAIRNSLGEIDNAANLLYKDFIAQLEFDMSHKNNETYNFQYFDDASVRSVIKAIKSNSSLRHIKSRLVFQRLLTEFMESKKPVSMLVMPYLSHRCELSCMVAKSMNIPTLSMPTVTIDANRRSIPLNWGSDLIACYGSQCKMAFEAMGHTNQKLVITGNATLDTLLQTRDSIDSEYLADQLGVVWGKRIILLATSRIDRAEHKWINPLLDFLESRTDVHLVIKPHPSYGIRSYSKVRKSPVLTISDTLELHEVMKKCEVLITDYSTTGAEAALLGKDVVVVNLLGKKFPSNRYDELGIAPRISELEQIPVVMSEILEGVRHEEYSQARLKFVDAYNAYNDGHAGERIANILINPDDYLFNREVELDQVEEA